MSKLRKDDEAHREKWRGACDRGVDHREHAFRVRAHGTAIERVGKICLARGRGVPDVFHYFVNNPSKSVFPLCDSKKENTDGTDEVTMRVLYVSRYFRRLGVSGERSGHGYGYLLMPWNG